MFVWSTFKQEFEGGGEVIDPDDQWSDREDSNYSWSLGKSASLLLRRPTTRIRCGAIVDTVWVDVDTEVGEKVWVVSVVYSTGDTFGRPTVMVVCLCL